MRHYKKVVLVRHGVDERVGPGEGEAAYGLGEKGRTQINASGQWLLGAGLGRVRIYTSTRRRAKESAEILSTILQAPVEECGLITESLSLSFCRKAFRSMMNALDKDDSFDTVILVTHSPDQMAFIEEWGRLWERPPRHWFANGSTWLLHPDRRVEQFHPEPPLEIRDPRP